MKVCITETLERIVEGESVEDVRTRYRSGEIVLDADDFTGVEFSEMIEDDSTDC